jgi:hypothetical protein
MNRRDCEEIVTSKEERNEQEVMMVIATTINAGAKKFMVFYSVELQTNRNHSQWQGKKLGTIRNTLQQVSERTTRTRYSLERHGC